MGEQNKILDVTYGKFSCRLEGFDDAVETMKAVVSYFHELAGNENFFDAVRGIPDLDTLARLTEAQSGGAVTAEPHGHGVSLTRQPEEAAEREVEEEGYDDWSADAAEDDMADDLPSEEEDVAIDTDADVADPDPNDDTNETASAADVRSAKMRTRILRDSWDEDDQAFLASAGFSRVSKPLGDDRPDPASEDAELGRKLSRIRDAVSRSQSPSAQRPAQDTSVTPLRPGNPLAQRLAELAKRNSELMQADDRAISPLEEKADEDEDAEDLLRESDDSLAEDIFSEAVTETAEDDLADPEDWEAEDFARSEYPDAQGDAPDLEAEDIAAAAETEDHLEDGIDIVAAEAADGMDDTFSAGLTDEEDANADAPETLSQGRQTNEAEDVALEAGADAEDAIAASNADDDDAAMSGETIDGDDDDNQDAKSSDRPLLLTTPRPRNLSEDISEDDDDDFDLSAELAEIEKEIANRPRNEMSRHGLPTRVEDAMSRIFSETNQQLEEPEGRRQRDALAQLKAAVAATEAARQLGDNARSRDAGQTFRDDLGALSPEGQPRAEGLPPLKLVKTVEEERAEGAEAIHAQPRVSSKPLDVAADRLREIAAKKDAGPKTKTEDFVVFLDRHGVTDLGDRLEAAAAYITFVEGEADFTLL